MKVIDILMQGANLLNLPEISNVLNDATEENQEQLINNAEVKSLFDLLKYSIQELCTNYVPVVEVKNITTTDKQYAISNLENYIRIRKVFQNGSLVKHKIINRNLVFAEDGELKSYTRRACGKADELERAAVNRTIKLNLYHIFLFCKSPKWY